MLARTVRYGISFLIFIASLLAAAGNVTRFGYDATGRLVGVTNALGAVTTYGYDAGGRLVSQTDANNHTSTYEYDPLGRRIKRTLPGGEFETLACRAIHSAPVAQQLARRQQAQALDSVDRNAC